MAEHIGNTAVLHATEVEPRTEDMEDMAGGTDIGSIDTAPAYREEEKEAPPVFDEKKELETTEANGYSSSIAPSLDGDEPTDEERNSLRHVSDKLPWAAFLVAAVELCERFTYYGLSGPFQNYIQHPFKKDGVYPDGVPGALAMGESAATGLTDFFQFWCYVTPIIGAIVADSLFGKYKTICKAAIDRVVFSIIYMVGLLILFLTSLPSAIEHGAGLGGLIAAMIIIGLGTGGIKSNVSPLIAEQYRGTKMFLKTLKGGERVIVDPAVTIQRIYMIFYMCINVGSLSSIATTELEKNVGFWTAYLLPMLMFFIGFAVLILSKKFTINRPPQGSVIVDSFRCMWIGLVSKFNMDAAKPSYQEEYGRRFKTPWDDLFVEEIKRALIACKVFLFFPIYWVVYSQMLNNFTSQAGTMELHGIPNDIMQNIDPITIIIFIPICDYFFYPFLRKIGIPFKPMTRITFGFFLGSLAMAYAAIVQHLIYSAPPCYDLVMACPASDGGTLPNKVHVAVQTPAYLFIGISEIFASITGLEYAYTKAPPSMKSFVMSMFLVTSAFGSALGIALSPTAKGKKLMWMYIGLCIACTIAGCIFWLLYSRYNATEDEMNELELRAGVADPDAPGGVAVRIDGRKSRPCSTDGSIDKV